MAGEGVELGRESEDSRAPRSSRSKLKQRIPKVEVRSPERLFEELDALELVIDLRRKLGN